MSNNKIVARYLGELKEKMKERSNCIIYVTHNLVVQIYKLDNYDYMELCKELKTRNIKIEEVEKWQD